MTTIGNVGGGSLIALRALGAMFALILFSGAARRYVRRDLSRLTLILTSSKIG